jgi:predicted secreted protein
MKTLNADNADQTVTIAPGEEINVALQENPTTGFRWSVESVSGEVAVLASDFNPASGPRHGAGGQRTVRLRAGDDGGPGELRLRYNRPGADASEAKHLRFVFAVTPA